MARGVLVAFAILVCLMALMRVALCHYTPTWAVHVPAGKETADAVALDHGFVNLGEELNSEVLCILDFLHLVQDKMFSSVKQWILISQGAKR
ncbi:jg14703 [Pararge aegeria aegeria]|uniref:Jg14703 protein n=1 Tax=Pararge aegeria aegeria TaxID=348720 RepID=A0A8S4SES4_9NEOP|nr:jg14703 [Pararge aegeria aegeria]